MSGGYTIGYIIIQLKETGRRALMPRYIYQEGRVYANVFSFATAEALEYPNEAPRMCRLPIV